MTPVTQVKLYPVQAIVGGVVKWIGVVATEAPDSIGSGGMLFRGEFDPTQGYNFQNVVVITSGDNAGQYIYISPTPSTGSSGANPTANPYVGAPQWLQIGVFGGNGSWG